MSRIIFLFVAAMTIVCISEAVRPCARGEHWNDCGGCQSTCDNKHPMCTKKCHSDCFCNKGTVRRNKGGPCVKITQCPNGIE